MKILTLRVDDATSEKLRAIRTLSGVTQSKFARDAISDMVQNFAASGRAEELVRARVAELEGAAATLRRHADRPRRK